MSLHWAGLTLTYLRMKCIHLYAIIYKCRREKLSVPDEETRLKVTQTNILDLIHIDPETMERVEAQEDLAA